MSQHLGIWLTENQGEETGTLWHITKNHDFPYDTSYEVVTMLPCASGGTPSRCKRRSFFNLDENLSDRAKIIHLDGSCTTYSRIEEAKKSVLRKWHYKMPAQNCQSFVLDILIKLREWEPRGISEEAIRIAQEVVSPTVKMSTNARQKKYAKQDEKAG
jgi:hypothetical protein